MCVYVDNIFSIVYVYIEVNIHLLRGAHFDRGNIKY